jgi:TatD DNase family protein
MYIDSHAHLTSKQLLDHVDAIASRAKEHGIEAIVNICTDKDSLEHGLELSKRYDFIYNAAATTPHDVEKEGELYFDLMAEAALSKKLVAVGETGLDYFYNHSPKELQAHFLRKYFALALEADLPVVIHCREAFADFFALMDTCYKKNGLYAPGVLHCFTGTLEEALELVKRGWYISFSGIITFKKSTELRNVVAHVPLEHILVETDSPYLAPQKYRGMVNEPAYVSEVVQTIAEVKGLSIQAVAKQTAANAKTLFRL